MADLNGEEFGVVVDGGSINTGINGEESHRTLEAESLVVGAVARVDVMASDMLELVFSQPMRAAPALFDAANYSVSPDGDEQAVRVREAINYTDAPTLVRVFLVVSEFTVGGRYTVTVAQQLRTTSGGVMHSGKRSAKFIGRRTKLDEAIESRSPMYSMAPGGVYRALLMAVMREDDLLGGSRRDRLP
jgi:hypothetical protein